MKQLNRSWRSRLAPWACRLLVGVALGAGVPAVAALPASAATTATFNSRVLTVFGDGISNTIVVGRDAAGNLLVNGGAIVVAGGTPTVSNTTRIQVFGQGGDDVISLSEINGALPPANLFGGVGNDTLTGGSGADQLFGQDGNDALLGRGGNDLLFGGGENDTLTGGDADDQIFGQAGDDRTVWNPGDDTDVAEGGDGVDTVEVNGGNGTEQFTTATNGTRVRFDRINPAPFSLDIGTSENLVVNANGGDDSFAASGNLAPLIKLMVDGGAGNDTLLGGNGADTLLGGDGDDVVAGLQGNDVALLGSGDDTFQWNPGDGSDTVEGQDGTDRLGFSGANANENITLSANGSRVRLSRDLANITMDLNGVENIDTETIGGSDTLVLNDLSGTGVANVIAGLGTLTGANDGAADNVVVNATSGDDVASIVGAGTDVEVFGLSARISVLGGFAPSDRLTVNALAGDDVLDASGMSADTMRLTLDGGVGDDILLGGAGDDTLLGGDGNDVLIGGPGNDTLDGGQGDNIVLDEDGTNTVASATVAGKAWVTKHARTVNGKTVLDVNGGKRTLPHANLSYLTSA